MKILFVLCLIYFIHSQNVFDVQKRENTIIVDGVVSEEEWQNISALDLVTVQPVYLKSIDKETIIKICYDENYIYLSAKMYVNSAGSVRANSFDRDSWNGDDVFGVLFDSYNDNRNMLWFYTNPNGSRSESEVFNEGEQINQNWNTYWKAESTYDDNGWYSEMRIPFSSLKFETKDEHVVMGLILYRYMADGSQRYMFPDIEPVWERPYAKASLAQKIRFNGIKSKKTMYISPYVLSDFNQDAVKIDNNRQYQHSSNFVFGFDTKINIDAQQTVDLTLNMDFAQAEVDDEIINTSRFPLFFPEKRRFFQERSELFLFNFYDSNRLFHSRNIGLNSVTRQPIKIIGGMRYTAKFNKTDIGTMVLQTEGNSNIESENFTVIRLRQSILNEQSNTGLMYTGRIINADNYSMMIGSDTELRWVDQHFITMKFATSINHQHEYDLTESSKFYLKLNNRSYNGLTYSV